MREIIRCSRFSEQERERVNILRVAPLVVGHEANPSMLGFP